MSQVKDTKVRFERRRNRSKGNNRFHAERYRLVVSRSTNHISAQVIDDHAGKTVLAASTQDKSLQAKLKKAASKVEKSKIVGEELPNPLAGNGGHFTKRERCIVGFSFGTNEGESHMAFPNGRHTFTCVAAPALAKGILREDAAADLLEVPFVNPGLADCHYITPVVEHETVAVGVAEKIESDDISLEVNCRNRLITSIDPNKFSSPFNGLFYDP